MKVHGHRGFSSRYPENTMLSFEKALEHGAHGVEIDVRRTSDGVYVIMHDPTVDRTTEGTGSVDSLTYEYISQLDAGAWRGDEFSGLRVPTLEGVLERFRDTQNFELNLHVNTHRDFIYEILDIVSEKNMLNRCYIFSGDNLLLSMAKDYAPAVKCITGGMPTIENYENFLNWALSKNLDFVSYNAFSNPESDIREMSENIHSSGLQTYASYIYNNYDNLVPMHMNNGTDIVLVDDVAITLNIIDPKKSTLLEYYKRVPYVKIGNGFVKTEMYLRTSQSYTKIG